MNELTKKVLYVMGVIALIQNGADADIRSEKSLRGDQVEESQQNIPQNIPLYYRVLRLTTGKMPSNGEWRTTFTKVKIPVYPGYPQFPPCEAGDLMDTPIDIIKRANGLLEYHVAKTKVYEGTEIHFPIGYEYWPGYTLKAPLDITQDTEYDTAREQHGSCY